MLKILCVEDDYIASYLLHEQIERMGYNIIDKLETGEEALEMLEWLKPDVILMDIKLSGELDGVETTRRIMEDEDIPVIFITGMTDPAIWKRAKDLNPHAFFTKPVDLKELQKSIETIFTNRMNG